MRATRTCSLGCNNQRMMHQQLQLLALGVCGCGVKLSSRSHGRAWS